MNVTAGAIIAATAFAAHADGPWTIGAGAGFVENAYKSYDRDIWPDPVIGYDGESVWFDGLEGGYYLWNDQSDKLSVMANFAPQYFRPKDSDNRQLRQLNHRRPTVMAGLSYVHISQYGALRTSLAGDILDNSNGIVWDTAWLYSYTGGKWEITPGIGVVWNSANQNRYYYGVSYSESRHSGLKHYNPDSSWNPYLELTVNYHLTSDWTLYGTGRYTRLSDEEKDSPMVGKSWTGLLSTGITYSF
ncbi:MipA/OmpV family protein [Shimwellia pseudoproteus]|uniref:MipA/OmpV family protein n=1 Tax=Shimwellia pseudoproteus TaxID=570012 RepID=UPI001E3948DB|nr:MipA/OmpV family protein [Shimwellia pseudoproteus]